MPQKETLEEFVKNLGKYGKLIEMETIRGWNKNTKLAMGKAQKYAPVKTGQLQGRGVSSRRCDAISAPTLS